MVGLLVGRVSVDGLFGYRRLIGVLACWLRILDLCYCCFLGFVVVFLWIWCLFIVVLLLLLVLLAN